MSPFIYKTTFKLLDPIQHDKFESAQAFLIDDDMTQYLSFDSNEDNKTIIPLIQSIEWKLLDYQNGEIEVIANSELTVSQKNKISNWISNQNSDGLGESFEQHFSFNLSHDWRIVPSFDYKTNKYNLISWNH